MIKVVHHQRRPGPGRLSIERVFSDVRTWLPCDIEARVATCRFESRGLLRRAYNTLSAGRQRADVHHVVGDVHYLTLGLHANETVLTIHDCAALHRLRGARRFLLWAFWYYFPIRKAKIVTTISEFTKNELLREVKCDPGRIRVIHNPLSSPFAPVAASLQGDVPTLLQVGTGPTKNLGRVFEALRGIRCRLWVVGPLSTDQRRRLESCGIEYRNFVQVPDDDLASLYVQSNIVIVASTYEGFGLPIIEAQAVGRPVIVSNKASLPEVAGGAAEFVDPYDQRSIGDAVRKLISNADLRERLVVLGRENIKRFEPRRIAEEYATIYRNVASG